MKNKRIRWVLQAINRGDDLWCILQLCDTRKEALAICKHHIDCRKFADSVSRDHHGWYDLYRVVRREEKVIFTERKEVFE